MTPLASRTAQWTSVRVENVEVGETVLVGGVSQQVSSKTLYNLAYPDGDRVILTSNPPAHRWQVWHLLLTNYGIVRFGHEHLAALRVSL